MSRKVCWIYVGRFDMEGALLFSTRCINVILLKMFSWHIFKMLCSLRISLVWTNFFIKNNRYSIFLLTVNFFKVCPVGTAPGYTEIDIRLCRFAYMSSKELVGYFCLKKVWPYKVVLNFLLLCFLYI